MLLTLKQASQWASEHLNKNVTPANITYLIQYGRIESVVDNGSTLVPLQSLKDYYSLNRRETRWKDELGDDLNWTLSFEKVKEAETTKHVHRLHPYKGKFIPQRPVLNRTEKNRNMVYPEMIFHFKEKSKKSEHFAEEKV